MHEVGTRRGTARARSEAGKVSRRRRGENNKRGAGGGLGLEPWRRCMRLGRGEERRERGVKQEEFLRGGAEARRKQQKRSRRRFGLGALAAMHEVGTRRGTARARSEARRVHRGGAEARRKQRKRGRRRFGLEALAAMHEVGTRRGTARARSEAGRVSPRRRRGAEKTAKEGPAAVWAWSFGGDA